MSFATDEWKICQMSIVYKRKNGSISIHNLKTLFPAKDDSSELKSVTFMLLSMCDFLLLFVMCDFFTFVFRMKVP